MWQSEKLRVRYAMQDVEVTEPLAPIMLAPAEGGAHVLVRYPGRPVGRVWLSRAEHGASISAGTLSPPLTIAVCTRNRATLLRRCLAGRGASRHHAHPSTDRKSECGK